MKSLILLSIILLLCFLCSTGAASQTTTVHPHEGNTYQVGADGEKISLINYKNAVNPTYSKLLSFIKSDKTDQKRYVPGKYVCSDFAETLHNNAEKKGIKAGWVAIDFKNDDKGHACNAFNTTDRGLVFIDCTGSPYQSGGWDTKVKLSVGKTYKPTSLYPPNYTFSSMGKVKKYRIYW